MFRIVRTVLGKIGKFIGMVLGIVVAVTIIPALFSLFGTGAVAGAVVTAVAWVGDKVVTTLIPALAMLVQSLGLAATAALLLIGFLLLGTAGLILDLVDAMACSLVDGYRCVRAARPPAAA